FFENRLTLSYRPGVLFNINDYTSTVDGAPNTRWTLSHELAVDWQIVPKLTLSGLAIGAINYKEQMQYQTGPVPNDGTYSFSLQLAYQLSPHFAPHFIIEQSDGQIKDGDVHVYLYDPQNTRYVLGFEATL